MCLCPSHITTKGHILAQESPSLGINITSHRISGLYSVQALPTLNLLSDHITTKGHILAQESPSLGITPFRCSFITPPMGIPSDCRHNKTTPPMYSEAFNTELVSISQSAPTSQLTKLSTMKYNTKQTAKNKQPYKTPCTGTEDACRAA